MGCYLGRFLMKEVIRKIQYILSWWLMEVGTLNILTNFK
jgi:hypothetical protein